jgi:hypothetical protein
MTDSHNAHIAPAHNPSPEENDVALFALAERCAAAGRRLDESRDAIERAEKRGVRIEPPKDLYKLEADAALRLFAGKPGDLYCRDEINVLRALSRSLGGLPITLETCRALERCNAILAAWAGWKERTAVEEATSGLAEAQRAYSKTYDEFETLAGQLLRMRAHTAEGVMAKVRAMKTEMREDNELAEALDHDLSRYGVDDAVVSVSLMRDIRAIAEEARH